MKLIGAVTSPYVRKVRIVMAEKRIDFQFVLENPWDAATTVPEYNPLGKIPTLVMEDGGAVFDSRVIVEYLDTITPVNKLIPASGRARVEVRCWEALGDGVTEAIVAVNHERLVRPSDFATLSHAERPLAGASGIAPLPWRGAHHAHQPEPGRVSEELFRALN